MSVSFENKETNRGAVSYTHLPAATPWRLFKEDTLSMAVYASLEYLNINDACIRCQIDSAIPEKRGMGSSAAISIARCV